MPRKRPHFLHIGPARTGTTWLHRMLRQHPNVYVNPVKEVRYFWEAHAYPGESLVARFREGDWHNRDYRDYLGRRLKWYLKHPVSAAKSADRLIWDCKFLFGRRSDEWFESLFRCEGSKITGDFSPDTHHLPPEDIVRVSREWPATKVLLTLRDPVEWSWSFARMWLIPDRAPAEVTDSEFCDFVDRFAPSYPTVSTISTWERTFAGRFQLLFFDDIAADPARVLSNVCNFLGLATAPIASFDRISDKRYPSRPLAMPSRFRRMLIALYEDRVRQLAQHFGGHPQRWLESWQAAEPSL